METCAAGGKKARLTVLEYKVPYSSTEQVKEVAVSLALPIFAHL